MTKKAKFGMIVLLAMAMPVLAACGSNSEFDDVMAKYSDLASEYEKLASKQPLCTKDILEMSSTLTPKLNSLKQSLEKLQQSNTKPDQAAIAKYAEISSRLSAAMMKISSKAPSC